MIESLSEVGFSKFGQIIYDDFSHGCRALGGVPLNINEHTITSEVVTSMVSIKDSPTVIDVREGLGLLCVTENPSSGQIFVFLLEKPVILNSNIYYSAAPLYGSCSIIMAQKEGASIREYILKEPFSPIGSFGKVNIERIYTLFYQEKEAGFIFKGERHNFWELTYVDKGVLYSSVDGKNYTLSQGEFMFYDKNQHHIQWASDKVSFITVTFDMDFVDENIITNKKFMSDEEMKELMDKIIYEKDEGSYYSDDLIVCYLKEFIIKLVRGGKLETTISSLNSSAKNKVENSIVSKAEEYIHANIDKKLTIPMIAKYVHISQSYLSTTFKRYTGFTLVDYINNLKLEKAKNLIKTTDLSITEIADMLGYNSVHYFSRQFKEKYGVSPTAYREK